MRAYDLTVTGSLIVSGSTTLTGDITYDDLTATGDIVTTGANKVISGSSTSTGSFGAVGIGVAPGTNGLNVAGTGYFTGNLETAGTFTATTIESFNGSHLQVKRNDGSNAILNIANTHSGNALIQLDASNGDFSGNDFASISHRNSSHILQIETGTSAGNIKFKSKDLETLELDGLKVSGSSTSTGSFGLIKTVDDIIMGTSGKPAIRSYNVMADTGIRFEHPNANDITISTHDGGDLMTFDSSTSRVGIGTTSPTRKLHVEGDALVTGVLTAQEFHTEYVSASVVYTSGSTKFGDTMDDEHQFTGSLQLSGSTTNESYIIGTNVGIGTTDPGAPLHAQGSSFPVALIERTVGSGTTGASAALSLRNTTTGNMADTFGVEMQFRVTDSGITDQALGAIHVVRDGADNNGTMNLRTYSGGTAYNRLTVDTGGNVGIGATSPAGKLDVSSNSGGGSPTVIIANHVNDTEAGNLIFRKTRGTTIGTAGTVPSDDDQLGLISFYGSDSNSWERGALIMASADGDWANDDLPTRLTFHTVDDGTAGLDERMRIDNAGKVGIGTNNPSVLLHLLGANAELYIDRAATSQRAGISFTTNGAETNGAWAIRMNDGGATDTTPDLSFHKFTGTDAEVMRLTDGGNVGIGITSPTVPLQVEGAMSASGALTVGGGLTVTGGSVEFDVDADSGLAIANAGTNAISIYAKSGDTLYLGSNNGNALSFDSSNNATFIGNTIFEKANGKISGSSTSTGSFGDLSINQIHSRNHASTGRPGLTQVQGGTDWAVGIGTAAPSTGFYPQFNLHGVQPAILLQDSAAASSDFLTIMHDANVTKFWSNNDSSAFIHFGNAANVGGTSLSNKISFDLYNGRVGIGTATPDNVLHIYRADNNWLKVDAVAGSSAGVSYASGGSNKWYVGYYSGAPAGFSFYDANKTGGAGVQMFIASGSGNVGIGTTGPKGLLHIEKDLGDTSAALSTMASHHLVLATGGDTNDTAGIGFYASGDEYIGAAIQFKRIGNAGTGDLTFYVKDDGDESSGDEPTAVMTMNDDGKVGIGTTSPSSMLDIEVTTDGSGAYLSAAGGALRVQQLAEATHGQLLLYYGADNSTEGVANMQLSANNGGYISGSSSSTGSFGAGYIDNKLGIGTTAPNSRLNVWNGSDGYSLTLNRDSDSGLYFGHWNGTSDLITTLGANRFDFGIGGNIKMSIASDGKVGIGTASPLGVLDVSHGGTGTTFGMVVGADDGANTRTNSTAKYWQMGLQHYTNAEEKIGIIYAYSTNDTNGLRIGGSGGSQNAMTEINFYTAGNTTTAAGSATLALGLDSSANATFAGNVSGSATSTGSFAALIVGTGADPVIRANEKTGNRIGMFNNSPTYHLDVTPSAGSAYCARIQNGSTTDNAACMILRWGSDSAGATGVRINDGADNQVGMISHNGTNAAYGTTSDYRLKENEVSISDGLTRLNKLKPYKFNWKKFPDRDKEDGFFAHEVEGIVPQAISGEKDAVDEDGEMIIQSMDKSSLVPLLVAAVQELSEKNEALEKRIEELEK